MGARIDAALTLFVLAAVLVAFALANAALSILGVVLGGLATLAFEAVAARDPETVRDYWERPAVQAGAVVVALVGVLVGATVASSAVLSVMTGALVAYLGFLAVVTVVRRLRA